MIYYEWMVPKKFFTLPACGMYIVLLLNHTNPFLFLNTFTCRFHVYIFINTWYCVKSMLLVGKSYIQEFSGSEPHGGGGCDTSSKIQGGVEKLRGYYSLTMHYPTFVCGCRDYQWHKFYLGKLSKGMCQSYSADGEMI